MKSDLLTYQSDGFDAIPFPSDIRDSAVSSFHRAIEIPSNAMQLIKSYDLFLQPL